MTKAQFTACLASLSVEHSTKAADILFDTIDLDRVRSIYTAAIAAENSAL